VSNPHYEEISVKKKIVIIIAALVVGIALAVVIFPAGEGNTLQVSQVGADPFAYKGTITITGIMAGLSTKDSSILGIFDVKELQCKTPSCSKLYLPVRHQGSIPKIGDEIRVTGSFEKIGNDVVFAAQKIKVVRNHQIGG
jgi:hypothetical protein